MCEEEFWDESTALDRRLMRQSMVTISTDGPYSEVTFREPFRRKHNDLSGKEVIKLYDAISFAQWQFGPSAIFNAHVTILWQTYGITDHEHASALLGLYLNEAGKWAKTGQNPDPRRQRARTGQAFIFRWIYVNENTGQQGFHSHVLTALSQRAVAAILAWTRGILRKLTGQAGDETSVDIKVRFGSERVMIDRCWHWFRYLAKQCDAHETDRQKPGLRPGPNCPLAGGVEALVTSKPLARTVSAVEQCEPGYPRGCPPSGTPRRAPSIRWPTGAAARSALFWARDRRLASVGGAKGGAAPPAPGRAPV